MSTLSRDRIDAFRRSSALQRLAAEREDLAEWLQTQPRKIIPVAEVARVLGVSIRQLWKWIEQGWISTYKRPSEHYQKGISKPGFTRFLHRLAEAEEVAPSIYSPKGLGRPPVVGERLKEAYGRSQQITDGMTPKDCAKVLGVSEDSVIRALKKGAVRSYKPSPHRYRVGAQRKKGVRELTVDLTAL